MNYNNWKGPIPNTGLQLQHICENISLHDCNFIAIIYEEITIAFYPNMK